MNVLERIQTKLLVPILGTITDDISDTHWVWQGKIPIPTNKSVKTVQQKTIVRRRYVIPPRIRDDDGKLQSVSRILMKELRGLDLPHTFRRISGCDYTCVNPYHIKTVFAELEAKNDQEDEIEALSDDLRNFIAAHGRNEHAIRDRFGLDYTNDEITLALRKIT